MYSRLKAGVHPKKKNSFLVQTRGGRGGGGGIWKVNYSTGTKTKGTGYGMTSWLVMTVNHVTHPAISVFCFSECQGAIKCSGFLRKYYYFLQYFRPFAGAWAHHKGCRRLKPCQWRRTVHWHCEWERKCLFCLTANNHSAHSWTRGP